MFQTFDETALTNAVAPRVGRLRQALAKLKVDAFLVPRGDRHKGEYVPAHDERLKWLTAFSGSAGLAVVAPQRAVLFVDGRYTVQARQQTDTSLFEIEQVPAAKTSDWLLDALGTGLTVGFAGSLFFLGHALAPFMSPELAILATFVVHLGLLSIMRLLLPVEAHQGTHSRASDGAMA